MWNDSPENVLILGHRGMRSIYPENTIISFKSAIDARVDLIGMDLHMNKDGVLVVCHDETVDRTTDGTGLIREKTLSEIKTLDAGIKKGLKFKGERIPTFREFLELINFTGSTQIGDKIATLVSLSLTPLKIEEIIDIKPDKYNQ